jgi:hypothetical protein
VEEVEVEGVLWLTHDDNPLWGPRTALA